MGKPSNIAFNCNAVNSRGLTGRHGNHFAHRDSKGRFVKQATPTVKKGDALLKRPAAALVSPSSSGVPVLKRPAGQAANAVPCQCHAKPSLQQDWPLGILLTRPLSDAEDVQPLKGSLTTEEYHAIWVVAGAMSTTQSQKGRIFAMLCSRCKYKSVKKTTTVSGHVHAAKVVQSATRY